MNEALKASRGGLGAGFADERKMLGLVVYALRVLWTGVSLSLVQKNLAVWV